MVATFKILFFITVVTLVNCGILPKKNFQNVHLFHPFVNSLSLPRTSAAKTVAEPCDENQLNFCATNLAKALNLTSFPENAAVFFYDIISIVYNGIKGFEDSCKSINEFVGCLGSDYDTCTSVANIEKIGEDAQDATVYATLAQQMKYECGAGYEIFHDQYYCAVADVKAKLSDLFHCISAFNESVYTDPTKICVDVQTLVDCYKNIFSDCGADFPVVLCETMKAGFSISLPQCEVSCSDKRLIQKSFVKRNNNYK